MNEVERLVYNGIHATWSVFGEGNNEWSRVRTTLDAMQGTLMIAANISTSPESAAFEEAEKLCSFLWWVAWHIENPNLDLKEDK